MMGLLLLVKTSFCKLIKFKYVLANVTWKLKIDVQQLGEDFYFGGAGSNWGSWVAMVTGSPNRALCFHTPHSR